MHEQPRRVNLDGRVREHPLHRLEAGDRLVELAPVPGVGDRLLEGALGDTDRQGTDPDATTIQDAQGVDESLPLPTEPVAVGDAAILHDDLRRVGRPAPHLVFLPAGPEALHALLEDERGDAVLPPALVRDGKHHGDIAHGAVRRERLAAVQDPVVAVAHGGRAGARCVAACRRLGEAPRADLLSSGQGDEKAPLLLLRSGHENMVRAQGVVGRNRKTDGSVHPRQFLDDEGVVQHLETGAAILWRKDDAQHPHVAELAHHLARKLLGLVELPGARSDLLLGELTNRLAGQLLLFGQLEIQSMPPGKCGEGA